MTICSTIQESGKLLAVDIAEMNPQYDVDQVTAKLATQIIYHIAKGLK